jgi:hypothetical protein
VPQGPQKAQVLSFDWIKIIENAMLIMIKTRIGGPMTFSNKLKNALALLESCEPRIRGYQPPFFGLLWVLGCKMPPPHFRTFSENRFFFSAALGTWMWIIFTSWMHLYVGASWITTLLISTPAGFFGSILTGHYMAKHYEKETRLHNIPQWKDFHPVEHIQARSM